MVEISDEYRADPRKKKEKFVSAQKPIEYLFLLQP